MHTVWYWDTLLSSGILPRERELQKVTSFIPNKLSAQNTAYTFPSVSTVVVTCMKKYNRKIRRVNCSVKYFIILNFHYIKWKNELIIFLIRVQISYCTSQWWMWPVGRPAIKTSLSTSNKYKFSLHAMKVHDRTEGQIY